MSVEQVLFYAFAFLTLLSAGMVIASRNPVHSALSLVGTFFFLAGVYVLLYAHTIAVLQVLVYAGAIMVLFVFVIMLLSLSEDEGRMRVRLTVGTAAGALAAAGLFVLLALVVSRVTEAPAAMTAEALGRFGTLAAIGQTVYTQWLLPFEAVSLLLLVAIVGAVVVAKARI
jgi:NADH-quinone oxidoreductase subunit J